MPQMDTARKMSAYSSLSSNFLSSLQKNKLTLSKCRCKGKKLIRKMQTSSFSDCCRSKDRQIISKNQDRQIGGKPQPEHTELRCIRSGRRNVWRSSNLDHPPPPPLPSQIPGLRAAAALKKRSPAPEKQERGIAAICAPFVLPGDPAVRGAVGGGHDLLDRELGVVARDGVLQRAGRSAERQRPRP